MMNTAINSNQNTNIAVINEAAKKFFTTKKNHEDVSYLRTLNKYELVKGTGDEDIARIISQLLFIHSQNPDFHNYLAEESLRPKEAKPQDLYFGWIRLPADEARQVILSTDDKRTVRRHFKKASDAGFIQERYNPLNGQDRALWYRVNLPFLVQELDKLGLELRDFPVPNSLIPTIRQFVLFKSHAEHLKRQFVACIQESLNRSKYTKPICNPTTTTPKKRFRKREEPPPPNIPEPQADNSSSRENLKFDFSLAYISPEEKAAIERTLNRSKRPQEVLDELNSIVMAGGVKKSRIGLLTTLIDRELKGTFNPTSDLPLRRLKEAGVSALPDNPVSRCSLCDENGIVALRDVNGNVTTTRCIHDVEKMNILSKKKGFEVIPHKKN